MKRRIDRIIDLSVRHRIAIFLLTAIGCGVGYWCMSTMRLDAVPDLGDTQVIIYSRWDRSPDIIEDRSPTRSLPRCWARRV